MESVPCLFCSSNKRHPVVSAPDYEKPTGELFHLQKCDECSLVYLYPRPTTQELPNYYNPNQYYSYVELKKKGGKGQGFFESLRQFLFDKTVAYYYGNGQKFLNGIFAWVGKGRFGAAPKNIRKGRILDIGCGDGAFLDLVQRLGWEGYGVEINSEAAKRANARGIPVHSGDLFSAGFQNNFFDLVRIWSVLEHVPNPKEVLQKIRDILKPEGVLILQVPNLDSVSYRLFGRYWSGLDLPRHFTHFTPKTLRHALEKIGFTVLRLKFASVGTSLASLRFWKSLQPQSNGKQKGWWLSQANPLLRITSFAFDRACDLMHKGDCIYVWAKKNPLRDKGYS